MTGQGMGSNHAGDASATVELRSVNHRGLKFVFRTSDAVTSIEPKIEACLKQRLRRGSVQVAVRYRDGQHAGSSMNVDVLKHYRDQIRESLGNTRTVGAEALAMLATLPGVFSADQTVVSADQVWTLVRPALEQAIDDFDAMRIAEGRSMTTTLVDECEAMMSRVDRIAELTPQVSRRYADRLEEKIQRVLRERGLETQPIDLIREVQIYADRVDISEEVTRLNSHRGRFLEAIESSTDEAVGRKLDFIIQEMFRETNTIGSKASDTEISAEVVEIKCALERMRELVQNLE